MKKIIFSSIILFASMNVANAWTFYQKNQSPNYYRQQAVTTYQQQLYSSENNLHPYSVFQSPYNNQSVRNNFDKYAHHIYSYDDKFQGLASQQIGTQNSVANPYGIHGKIYSPQNPSIPFDNQRWSHPNSIFQDPYNKESVWHNKKYGVQYNDSAGQKVGTKSINRTHENSVTGGFGQSPYDNHSIQNPYGGNKVFK